MKRQKCCASRSRSRTIRSCSISRPAVPASDAGFSNCWRRNAVRPFIRRPAAENPANAKALKALLVFNAAISARKIDESVAVARRASLPAGTDEMRAFRQLYAASRLLRHSIGLTTVIELAEEARKASDDALKATSLTMAVQADEFREPALAQSLRETFPTSPKRRTTKLQTFSRDVSRI